MKVVKMNMAQIHGAIAGFSEWLSQAPDFPFTPEKIEYAGKMDRFGMHHYILKFRRKGGPWILGVAGGYENDTEIAPFQYVGSMGTPFSESTMRKDAEILLDDMHQYFQAHPDDDIDSDEEWDDEAWDDDYAEQMNPILGAQAMQIVFLRRKETISDRETLQILRENWHVQARSEGMPRAGGWDAEVEGFHFTVHFVPLEDIRNLMSGSGADALPGGLHPVLSSENVIIVTCRRGSGSAKEWGPALAMLVDSCMEAGSGLGAMSLNYWISRDAYHDRLAQSVKEKKWPFSNFFGIDVDDSLCSAGGIKLSLRGNLAFFIHGMKIFGFFSKEEIPSLKEDLRELVEGSLFRGSLDTDVVYPASSGRRYMAYPRGGNGLEMSFTFMDCGMLLDSTSRIVRDGDRKSIHLKKIVEAGKRSAWFLRWVYEHGFLNPGRIDGFERYLKNARFTGDWRYALQYNCGGEFSSNYIVWKARSFVESYYLGKGKQGYKSQLKSYALKRLKGAKQEGLARLAGMNAFAYLPWDEETYHDVAAMIEAAYAAWQEEHR